jgi:hypothetical protein
MVCPSTYHNCINPNIDSDDSTAANDDDDEENRDDDGHIVQVGQGNNDPDDKGGNKEAIEDPIKAAIRRSTSTMFRRVLVFNDGAANSLYDDQMITTFDTL